MRVARHITTLPAGKATLVRVKYRAKNPLGAMAVWERAFFIQKGKVVASLDWNDWESETKAVAAFFKDQAQFEKEMDGLVKEVGGKPAKGPTETQKQEPKRTPNTKAEAKAKSETGTGDTKKVGVPEGTKLAEARKAIQDTYDLKR